MSDTQKEHARLLGLATDYHADALCALRLGEADGVREKYLADIREDVERALAVVEFLKANAPTN
jgi:hypothetical protein